MKALVLCSGGVDSATCLAIAVAQYGADEVLALSERGHTAADVENASSMLKESGFKLILQMMTGLPGDTLEKTVYTAKKIASLDPDGVRIYPTVIVKDTPLYDMWKRGEYKEHSIEEAVEYCAAILPVFEKAGIPVIRLGLNPTDDLSGGDAVGGAYHPALGEMVRSRLIYEKISKLINESIDAESLTVGVNPRSISQAVGPPGAFHRPSARKDAILKRQSKTSEWNLR